MSVHIHQQAQIQQFIRIASGLDAAEGNPRVKQIVHRLLNDMCRAIDELDITPDEFWAGVTYLNDLGAAGEAGLLAAGCGLEHYLDLRLDAEDAAAGIETGTSRTIEGPLYVAGAPISDGFARMDDGTDPGTPMYLHGVVTDLQGKPLAGAIVDIWHANTKGMYSFFDKSQSEFNLRRRIRTDSQGRYAVRSILPSGYGCPPEGPTQQLLDAIGRHGQRPAHIHFFVSADGYRQLTTQINLAGEEYLHDDFAYATRDDLIASAEPRSEAVEVHGHTILAPHAEMEFNFMLTDGKGEPSAIDVERRRAVVA